MNTVQFDKALRSLLEDIGDAAGTPRDFEDLPDIRRGERRRWAGTVAAVGLAAASLAGLIVLSTQRDAPDEVIATDAATTWLDMATAPDGTERVPGNQLTDLSVCVDAAQVGSGVVCNRLEGRVEVAYSSTSDADPTFEIQTLFSDLDLDTYITGLVTDGQEVSRTNLTVRGGRPAALIDGHNGVVLLVWQERPGAIGQFRSVGAPPDTDIPGLVEALIDRPWPADIAPPIAAVDLDLGWTASDNNHHYVIASHRDNQDCLSIGFSPADSATAEAACASDALGWTSGVLTTVRPQPESDVVAGWVPANAAAVVLTFDDSTVVELPTYPVAGFTRRAWGYLIPADQGAKFSARYTVLDNTDIEMYQGDIDFVNPLVFVDTVCGISESDGIVPNVVGLPVFDAADAVRSAGLIIALPLRGDPSQTVTAQDPAPGTDRGCGDVVLTVGPAGG